MSNRDFAFVALGRFMVVERYREICQPASAGQLPGRGPDRTGAHPGKPGSGSGSRAPGRPQHG
ncbi:MAG TPA: hypothetical protein VI751_07320 [Actinomycetota bacterium]